MNHDKFKTLEELYIRMLPALRTKQKEMTREKMGLVKEKDIWNYLCKKKWKKEKTLTLGEMVNDILKEDNFSIYTFKKEECYESDNSK